MNDDPYSVPYDTADYLESLEDIAEYLEVAVEDGDERLLLLAIENATRAAKRVAPAKMSGFSENQAAPVFDRLVALLNTLGFKLVTQAKQAA